VNDIKQIEIAVENFLIKERKFETNPVEAGAYLSRIGLLNDSKDRPGKPLRDILRKGHFKHAYQNGNRWVIPRLSNRNLRPVSSPKVTEIKPSKKAAKTISRTEFDLSQIENLDFRSTQNLNPEVVEETGFYFIRLKPSSTLPIRYKPRFDEQEHRIIYIGKAEGQSLADRLDQELLHTSPGTFFRSIGAVLDKTPISGHLSNSKRKNNYKFSSKDTNWIIDWLSKNVDVALVPYSGDFRVENSIIARYAPILNHTGNPRKCLELIEDRAKCRRIASGSE